MAKGRWPGVGFQAALAGALFFLLPLAAHETKVRAAALSTLTLLVAWGALLVVRAVSKERYEWLVAKMPELLDVSGRDVALARAVESIARHSSGFHLQEVLLLSVHPIHPIDVGPALEKLQRRARAIRANRDLIEGRVLTEELIERDARLEDLRSINGIQCVEVQGHLVSFEGNGRLEALRLALGEHADQRVQVRVFTFPDVETCRKIERRVLRCQKANGTA